MIVAVLLIFFLMCVITEKSDFQRMKETEELPPFTKEEAFNYYNENYGGNK